jgi:chromosome segregation ATPase
MEQVASTAKERAATAEQHALAADARAAVAERSVAEAEVKVNTALSALERARAERDAYEQEMFEVDRYGAWVSQDRQNLVWRVDELQRERDRLTQEASELHRERDRLTQEASELHRERDRLTQEIEHYRSWIQAMYSSTSWKIARPVRAARKLLNLLWVRR